MSPILVRPVREQLEHDRVIRLLQVRLKRRHEVATNIGEDVVFLVEGKSIKHHAEDRGDAPASGVYPAASGA